MRLAFILLFIPIIAQCDSKAEQDLRARLAAAQAQLASAAKDKAELAAALDKLNAAAVQRATTATANSRAAATGRNDASDQADTIARNARDLAQDHADIAKAAADLAASKAEADRLRAEAAVSSAKTAADLAASKAEADRLRAEAAVSSAKTADHTFLIVQIIAALVVLFPVLLKFAADDRRETRAYKVAQDTKAEVLGAVAGSQQVVADGLNQANHISEKTANLTQQIVDMKGQLLTAVTAVAAMPDTTEMLAGMLKGHAASAEDMGRVLSTVVANADALEKYSHKWSHQLRGLMAVLLAEAAERAKAGSPLVIPLAETETPAA